MLGGGHLRTAGGNPPGSHLTESLIVAGPTGATTSVELEGETPYDGYLVLTSDGGVSNFDTPWYGSPKASGSTFPGVVGIAATPNGGYVVLRANGGVFSYGTPWHGSLANLLPFGVHPVGITVDPATGGYWTLVSNVGVSNFDTPWHGLPKASGDGGAGTFTGISSAPGGIGYFVSRSNGGVFTCHLTRIGSVAGRLPTGVTGIEVAGQVFRVANGESSLATPPCSWERPAQRPKRGARAPVWCERNFATNVGAAPLHLQRWGCNFARGSAIVVIGCGRTKGPDI